MKKRLKVNKISLPAGIIFITLLMPALLMVFLAAILSVPAVATTILLSFVGLADVEFVEEEQPEQDNDAVNIETEEQ